MSLHFLASPRCLQWIQSHRPAAILLAETDADFNGPFFLSRFKEAYTRLSAIMESIDATLPVASPTRVVMEGMVGTELINTVGCEGFHRVIRAERFDQWSERMQKLGFERMPMRDETLEELRQVVMADDPRYRLNVTEGAASLSWCGTPLAFVATWHYPRKNS